MQQLDFSSLHNAVTSLQASLSVVDNEPWFSEQPANVRQTLVAGVVQNFEFVYELSVKMLRRQLEQEADSPADVDHASFRAMLRTAAEKGLIDDVESWMKYRQLRNVSSHTYDESKAALVHQQSRDFVKDAEVLLKNLEARSAS